MALSDDKIEQRMEELRARCKAFAKAKAQMDYLSEYKKSKLSILMKGYEVKGVKAANAQEREARSDPEYIEVLEGLKVATEEAEEARWLLKVAELGIEVWRTNEASKRAEKRGYGA